MVNATPKCTTANMSGGNIMHLSDPPWWKDAEVCGDIKFPIHILHDNKAQWDRSNSPDTADGSQTEFLVSRHTVPKKKILQDK